EAEKAAASVGKSGEIPEYSLAELEFPLKLFYLLNASGLCKSSGEGRRKINEGGVRLDGEKIADSDATFDNSEQLQGKVLQLGKKKFLKLV
ncbi:MAG: S4 domain-containing protein, partial [Cyanobacteria bacterium J06573_2]